VTASISCSSIRPNSGLATRRSGPLEVTSC
jgi:hypothetical protein